MKKAFKKTVLAVLMLSIIFLLQTNALQANEDFTITSSYNIYLSDLRDDFVLVEETFEIMPNNPNYYIPKDSEQGVLAKKDELVKDTLSVTDRYGRERNYEIRELTENYQIIIEKENNITSKNPFFAKVSYKTKEYINNNGNITNLYLPGLHEDVFFEEVDQRYGLNTEYKYFLSYHIPIDAPEHSFISPDTITKTTDRNYKTYTFSQEARLGNTGWIQIGSEQYYLFKITQEIPQTDFLIPEGLSRHTNWISTNILEIALPREFEENNQKVFFKEISPEPKRFVSDKEGNLLAIFDVDANKDQFVVIEGYIKLEKSVKEIPRFTISQYRERIQELSELETYTQADKYWETDSEEIKGIANRLLAENEDKSILDLIRANYNFVIERLDYSYEKVEGQNIRVGALKALEGFQAVCMEYSDLMIAISRAQGIPARSAIGYGNDPLITETEKSLGHQWVQIWYPDYGWLSVDPTWGETKREYIGGDLDHILFYTIGDSEQRISDSSIYSADIIDDGLVSNYAMTLEPLHKEDFPHLETLTSLSEMILKYDHDEENKLSDIEYVLKTTMLGRVIIFLIPIVIIIIIMSAVSVSVSNFVKLKRLKHS